VCGEGEVEPVDGCDHPEVALFESPSRSTLAAVTRLQRAIAERRAAERALSAIVATECARGRAMLERRPPPEPPPPPPCPACVAREEHGDLDLPRPPRGARAPRRKAAPPAVQMPLAFATPAPCEDARDVA
jgi:hypothetical protein